jgi:hypothetical protein
MPSKRKSNTSSDGAPRAARARASVGPPLPDAPANDDRWRAPAAITGAGQPALAARPNPPGSSAPRGTGRSNDTSVRGTGAAPRPPSARIQQRRRAAAIAEHQEDTEPDSDNDSVDVVDGLDGDAQDDTRPTDGFHSTTPTYPLWFAEHFSDGSQAFWRWSPDHEGFILGLQEDYIAYQATKGVLINPIPNAARPPLGVTVELGRSNIPGRAPLPSSALPGRRTAEDSVTLVDDDAPEADPRPAPQRARSQDSRTSHRRGRSPPTRDARHAGRIRAPSSPPSIAARRSGLQDDDVFALDDEPAEDDVPGGTRATVRRSPRLQNRNRPADGTMSSRRLPSDQSGRADDSTQPVGRRRLSWETTGDANVSGAACPPPRGLYRSDPRLDATAHADHDDYCGDQDGIDFDDMLDTSDAARGRLDHALKAINKPVYASLNLSLSWSPEQQKLAGTARKNGLGGTAARGETAYFSHWVELCHASAGQDAAKDGRLIRLAARYCRQGFFTAEFNQTAQSQYREEGKSRWKEAVSCFESGSRLAHGTVTRLLSHVTSYFDTRALMAKRDFAHTVLKEIALGAAQQAKDIKGLWEIYITNAAAEQPSVEEEHATYFDLLYPFYAEYVRVDKMDRSLITARKHRLGSGGFQGGSRWGTGGSYNHHTWGPPTQPVSTGPAQAHMQPPPPYTSAMATSAGASTSMAPLPQRPGHANGAAQATFGQRPGSGMTGFLGRPLSASVVGPALAVSVPGLQAQTCLSCPGNPTHFSFECPSRYARLLGVPCPGFDRQGARIPSAWAGNDITAQTKADWISYIGQHGLLPANKARGSSVNFS